MKGTHLHDPDSRKIEKKIVMNKIAKLAKEQPDKHPQHVIDESMHDVKDATKAKIPSSQQLKHKINRIRSIANVPKNPKDLSELNFTDEMINTAKGESFLLYDSGAYEEVQERIVIFATQKNIDFLAQCTEIYMDGTFSVTPPLFTQLYTIHGMYS